MLYVAWILFVIFIAWVVFFFPSWNKLQRSVIEENDIVDTNGFVDTTKHDIPQEVIIDVEEPKEPKEPKEDKWITWAKNRVRTIYEYDNHKLKVITKEVERQYRTPIKGYSNPMAEELLRKHKIASYQSNIDKVLHS